MCYTSRATAYHAITPPSKQQLKMTTSTVPANATPISIQDKKKGRFTRHIARFASAFLLFLLAALLSQQRAHALKHHLVLTNDDRSYFSVSTFTYLFAGRLEVIVQNLTIDPEPEDEFPVSNPQYGFVMIRLPHAIGTKFSQAIIRERKNSCMANEMRPQDNLFLDLIRFSIDPFSKKLLLRCSHEIKMPLIKSLPYNPYEVDEAHHSSYIHTYNKRDAMNNGVSLNLSSSSLDPSLMSPPSIETGEHPDRSPVKPRNSEDDIRLDYALGPRGPHESRHHANSFSDMTDLQKCPNIDELPLEVVENFGRRSYSFNFSMFIQQEDREGVYFLMFHNCGGRNKYSDVRRTVNRFNLSLLIIESNYPNNYLSAESMALPQIYFAFCVIFFLVGCIWLSFIKRQKGSVLKIHHLMSVLVFAKSSSLLFHGINFHYIALYGQPVVTWAYLYYVTHSIKGALFFITLALLGTGWSFIKHVLSEKDKKIILIIVTLQLVAHVGEILQDESSEGETGYGFWSQICGIVDLFSCVAILFPITWSVKHLEEAQKVDGKAEINLRKLKLFERFYIISTLYFYLSRVIIWILVDPMLSFKHTWITDFLYELGTLIYFVITGYHFQPAPTNPYLLLPSNGDNEADNGDEEVLFSLDSHPNNHSSAVQMNNQTSNHTNSNESPFENNASKAKVTRRLLEDIV